MTTKEIYCTGRAEYLNEYEGCSLSEGYNIAEHEYEMLEKDHIPYIVNECFI